MKLFVNQSASSSPSAIPCRRALFSFLFSCTMFVIPPKNINTQLCVWKQAENVVDQGGRRRRKKKEKRRQTLSCSTLEVVRCPSFHALLPFDTHAS